MKEEVVLIQPHTASFKKNENMCTDVQCNSIHFDSLSIYSSSKKTNKKPRLCTYNLKAFAAVVITL